ncbi:MAG: respiratory nitrate reductase subunit gamma [Fibrobacteres bacterium]|nr:respiratory nitrate reductase subunit gamma [Fibrobacterota bacterium]
MWIAGRRRASQLLVRLTITGIIATEFLGRSGTRPWALSLHALLALWLAGIFPFTHLRHVLWSPLALWFAWRRRTRHAIA